VSNPLLVFWRQLFGSDDDRLSARVRRASSIATGEQASATIFLIMRRMRAPLITLIVILAVSVLGLTLIPGQDGGGQPPDGSATSATPPPPSTPPVCWSRSASGPRR